MPTKLGIADVTGNIAFDLFTTRHKVVHNAGSPKFKGSLFDKKTTYIAQILQNPQLQGMLFHTTKIQFIWIACSNSGYVSHYGPDSLLL